MNKQTKISYSRDITGMLDRELARLRLDKDLIVDSVNGGVVSLRYYDTVYKIPADIVLDILRGQPSGYGSQEILYEIINSLEYYS